MRKEWKKSLLPQILLAVIIFGIFFGFIGWAFYLRNMKKNFWLDSARLMNPGNGVYSEYQEQKAELSLKNLREVGRIFTGTVYLPDRDVETTGEYFILYGQADDFVYKLVVEETDDIMLTRLNLYGKKRKYSYDVEGWNIYQQMLGFISEETEGNTALEQFPFRE